MSVEDTDLKKHSVTKIAYRFLGGVAIGAFIAIVPILYCSPTDLNLAQIIIALLLVILSGLLSSMWGEKFINAVMRVLDSFGA